MKTTPLMQDVITRLIHKHESAFYHSQTYSRLTLMLDEYLPLSIHVYPQTVQVAFEIDVDGFLSAPDITFSTAGGEWTPVVRKMMSRRILGSGAPFQSEEYYALPAERNLSTWWHGHPSDKLLPLPGMEKQQALTARFCEDWAQEIKCQGWLDWAHRA